MSFINSWLRDQIQAINAYHVPSAEGMLKLDAMESPYPIPDAIKDEYLQSLSKAQINRYPSADAAELVETLYELMDIPKDLGVLLGNGSDELIQLLALACDAGDTVLSVEPSFVMYEMIAKFTRLNYQGIALDKNFDIDLDAMLDAINESEPKIIFIAYPNNPTGNAFNKESIKTIIESTDAMVVVDEAYYAYADESFLNEVNRFDNLVLLRTISKIGFAGLRLGMLIANKETTTQLDKLRLPYNINTLTQISANFLLKHKDTIEKNASAIIDQRCRMFDTLSAINGIEVYPSQANFILFKAPDANLFFDQLKQQNILIKDLSNAPMLENCLRVTVGTEEENSQFLSAVERFYG